MASPNSVRTTKQMPRERSSYRIDARIIEGMKTLSERRGLSINATVEELLWVHLQGLAIIPSDAERLPETRGGKREGAFRKPTTAIELPEQDSPSEGEAIV